MRLRVLLAMVAASALSLALFALPLAELVQEYYRDQTHVALDERITTALAALSRDPTRAAEQNNDPDYQIGVYGPDGSRIAGLGPDPGDAIVSDAASGQTASVLGDDGSIAVAVPTSGGPATVIRGEASSALIDARVRTAWAAIVGLAGGVLAVVGLGAWFLSRRLVRPVDQLTADLHRLGDGDFDIAATTTGVSEIDAAHDALAATAARLEDTLQRERAFTADVAHQLRTPIASLRLGIEAELQAPRADPHLALHDALDEVDRLQSTTEDLLSLARHTDVTAGPIDTNDWLREGARRWEGPYRDATRTIVVDLDGELPPMRGHRGRLDQVLDIALDNALRHGQGKVTVTADAPGRHVHIAVADEGPGPARVPSAPGQPVGADGKRIGLDLARRIVESEGGRLRLAVNAQPAVTLILPTAPTAEDGDE